MRYNQIFYYQGIQIKCGPEWHLIISNKAGTGSNI
jgi:hypothetical protein